MIRKKRFRRGDPTSVRIEAWKAAVVEAAGVPHSLIYDKGFEVYFKPLTQGGKMNSKALEEILHAKVDERATLDEQIRKLEEALSGHKSEEINEIIKASTKTEVMLEILQPIERYFRCLPERDPHGLRSEAWSDLATKASEAAKVTITKEDLIKYVRERQSEALAK